MFNEQNRKIKKNTKTKQPIMNNARSATHTTNGLINKTEQRTNKIEENSTTTNKTN